MAKKKTHRPPEKDWPFLRERNDDHKANVAKGYVGASYLYMQVHHILIFASVQDSYIFVTPEQLDFIHGCMSVTTWDLNGENNVIALPLKLAYYDRPQDTTKWGLPCHQIDHNPYYSNRVIETVNSNVWQQVLEQEEDCSPDGTDISGMLDDVVAHWKTFLNNRGAVEEGGTEHCWTNRAKLKKWYVPFSMHPDTPPPRVAPKPRDQLPKNLKNLVSQFFVHA